MVIKESELQNSNDHEGVVKPVVKSARSRRLKAAKPSHVTPKAKLQGSVGKSRPKSAKNNCARQAAKPSPQPALSQPQPALSQPQPALSQSQPELPVQPPVMPIPQPELPVTHSETESLESKISTTLRLLKSFAETNRRALSGGVVAALVAGIIVGGTIGLPKVLPANTNVIQYCQGLYDNTQGNTYVKQGQLVKAIKMFEQAMKDSPNDPAAYKQLASLMETDTREMEKAEKLLKNAILLSNTDAELYQLLAYAQFWQGHLTDAKVSAQKAIDLSHGDAMSNSVMALATASDGGVERGKELMQQAINSDPKNILVLHRAAMLYRLYAKDDSRAEELVRQAMQLAPDNAANYFELSKIQVAQKKLDDAEQSLKKARSLQPDSPFRVRDLAEFYLYDVKKFEDANATYKASIEQGCVDTNVLYNYGSSLYNQGKYAEALIQYQKAVDLKSDNENALYMLGKTQNKTQNYKGALETFKKLVDMVQTSAVYVNWLGVAQFQSGDYKSAEISFQRAIELGSKDGQTYANVANAQYMLGKYINAGDAALKGLSVDPNLDDLWSLIDSIGNKMMDADQVFEAMDLFDAALKHPSTSQKRAQVEKDSVGIF